MAELPLIGPWKRKISRIDAMNVIDCVPNAMAIVVGAAVAGFNIFWSIGGPECVDQQWDKHKKGTKHRKQRANGTATPPTIGPPPGRYGATMISIGNAAQKAGFGMAIVDGVIDGIYYGSSLMRRYSGCLNPTAPGAQLVTGNVVPELFPAKTFIYGSWIPTFTRLYDADAGGVAMPAGTEGLITVAYGLTQEFHVFPTLPDCTFTSELIWLPSFEPIRQNYGGLGYNITGSGVLYGQDILRGPDDNFLGVKIVKTEGVMFIREGFLTVTGGNILANLSAYQCDPGHHKD